MVRIFFQFEGGSPDGILPFLLAMLISLILIAWGVYQRRQGRRGLGRIGLGAGVLSVMLGGAMQLVPLDSPGLWAGLLSAEIFGATVLFHWGIRPRMSRPWWSFLLVLRLLAAGILLAILFKPSMHRVVGPGDEKPALAVLLDRSGSMDVSDRAGEAPRYRRAADLLGEQLSRLEAWTHPVGYRFAQSLQPVEAFSQLTDPMDAADLEATDLIGAVRSVEAGRAFAVLVLSDGNDNVSISENMNSFRLPVYAIGVGDTEETSGPADLALLSAEAPLQAVRNNTVSVVCKVSLHRLAGVNTRVSLFEGNSSQPADTVELRSSREAEEQTVTLSWTPQGEAPAERADIRRLRIVASTEGEESLLVNNAAEIHVRVTDPEIRVLYIEGSVRPEFKFLRRLLSSDPNVQVMSLVRLSDERFLRQGSIDGRQLENLPQTKEDFDVFDVILLGDLDRRFLSDRSLVLLRHFVEGGGGLLVLGGQHSFGPGGYAGSDLERLLPVTVGSREMPQQTEPFQLQLTSAGENHPVFRGITGFFPGPSGRLPEAGLPALPPLQGCVTVEAVKPAAEVLAEDARHEETPLVVLAVQPFGAGRVAAFTADTTWRWDLPLRGLGEESPYRRFWGQLIRYLASQEATQREEDTSILLRCSPSWVPPGKAMTLRAYPQTEPSSADKITLQMSVTSPEGDGQKLSPVYQADTACYEATWTPTQPGTYEAAVTMTDSEAHPLGEDVLPLTVIPQSAEMDRLARNDVLLRQLAEQSGGAFAPLSDLPEVVDRIIARVRSQGARPPQERVWRLYHFPWMFGAFVALVSADWLLRRRGQLP